MSDALLKNTFNKISPAYELVADVTVATATTQVDFSGLNFGKDDDLLLVVDWVNGVASTNLLRLFFNENYTITNYYYQLLQANGTGVQGGRANDALIAQASASLKTLIESKIKLTNSGYLVSQNECSRNYGSGIILESSYTTSTFTATSITSLRISCSATNGIGIGSRFQLYRLKAKKVADIIVSTATTQVDITGLSIDKDSEYMLVSDVNNTSGSNASNYLCANGNNTLTNYYAQYIMASNTILDSARSNTSFMCRTNLGQKVLSIQKIKLTNNGYFTFQSDAIRQYGDSTCELQKSYGTSTFTMTSVTSLSIVSSVANGIGIGSRFTLYKMK